MFRRLAVLAAAIAALPSGSLRGGPVSVPSFDDALTNTTAWTYSGRFEYSSRHKAFGFRTGGSAVTSPRFPFAVTSVTANAWLASADTKRQLFIVPIDAAGREVSASGRNITPPSHLKSTCVTCSWPAASQVRRVRFLLDRTGPGDSSGNIYLNAASLAGTRPGFGISLR